MGSLPTTQRNRGYHWWQVAARVSAALALLLCLCGGAVGAESPRPAFLQPEVLRAAVAIDMTDEQKAQFRDAITNFAEARMRTIRQVRQRSNQTDLPRKIRSKTNGLLRRLDKQVLAFLTAEQAPAYEKYRNLFKENLRP